MRRRVLALPEYIQRQQQRQQQRRVGGAGAGAGTDAGAAGFACMREGQDGTMVVRINNFNRHLTEPLGRLLEFYSSELNADAKDQWRHRNMRKCVEFFKRLGHRVSSESDLLAAIESRSSSATGISMGGTTREKLVEILARGSCSALDARGDDSAFNAMRLFATIWGIGPVKARMLVRDSGLRTIAQLRARVFGSDGGSGGAAVPPNPPINPATGSEILGPDERECLKHYEDLSERMPREEAGEFVARVQEAAGRVFGGLDKILVVGAGSFRRGKATCGDIDVLITSQDFSTPLLDIKLLLAELHRTGLLVFDLRQGGGEEHFSVNDRIKSQEAARKRRAAAKQRQAAEREGVLFEESESESDGGNGALAGDGGCDAGGDGELGDLRAAFSGKGGGPGGAASAAFDSGIADFKRFGGRGFFRGGGFFRGRGSGRGGGFASRGSKRPAGGPLARPGEKARRMDKALVAESTDDEGAAAAPVTALAQAAVEAAAAPSSSSSSSSSRAAAAAPGAPPLALSATQLELLEGVTWLPEEESPHHLYMGLGRLGPGRKVRRIDIKVYERRVFAFACLYFTGSDYFNRSLRLLVSKCGWTLSDRGLCLANRVKVKGGAGGYAKTWTSRSIACNSERDVLTACGVPWREPRDRDMEVLEIDAAAPKGGGRAREGGSEGGAVIDAAELVDDEEEGDEAEAEEGGG